MPENKKVKESKKPEFKVESWEDVDTGLEQLRAVDDTIDLLTAEKNKKLKEIEDEYSNLEELSQEKKDINLKVSAFVLANRKDIPGGKSTYKSRYGEVFTMTGKPALTLRTQSGTWDKVVAGFESLFKGKTLRKYVKYTPSLQKENVKAAMDSKAITPEQAKELGIRITSGVSVLVKLYKEESK